MKKRYYSPLLIFILLVLLILSFGCGREWSVKGSSFPKEPQTDRSAPKASEKTAEEISSSAGPLVAEKEDDGISQKADELRKEADRLAQEADNLRLEKGKGEGASSAPGGDSKEQGATRRGAGTSGTFTATEALSDIFFDFDQYLLTEGAQNILQKNAEWLRSHPQARILIEGHCDERGTVEYNLALGERRSQSVKDYLSNLGISSDRISMISYGKEKPFVVGHSEESWAQNRRAHFLLQSP
jgi:peptidoglycan-associated lipoprotein